MIHSEAAKILSQCACFLQANPGACVVDELFPLERGVILTNRTGLQIINHTPGRHADVMIRKQ